MRVPGQMTVFFSMLSVILLSLLLVILESARSSAIRFRMALAADSALDSVFAGYQRELFDEYGLLFLWSGDEQIKVEAEKYFSTYMGPPQTIDSAYSLHPYPASVTSVEVLAKVSMTDQGGAVFAEEIARSLGMTLGDELLEKFMESMGLLEDGKRIHEEVHGGSSDILSSLLEEEEKIEAVHSDFFDQVTKALGSSLLTSDIFRNITLSGKNLNQALLPSSQLAAAGSETGSILDTYLLNRYISRCFSSVVEEKNTYRDSNGLSYEQEYILSGFLSDEENVKAAAGKLLALRQGMNLLHIYRDAKKLNMAEVAADVLALLLEMPAAKGGIKVLIITLWAYQESSKDLKILYEGGHIPLYKEEGDWQTNLLSFLDFNVDLPDSDTSAAGADGGLAYEEYLGLLLWTENSRDKRYRMMDMIHMNLQNRFPGFSVRDCYYTLEIKVSVTDFRGRIWKITRRRNYI